MTAAQTIHTGYHPLNIALDRLDEELKPQSLNDHSLTPRESDVFRILYKWLFAANEAGKTEAAKDVRKVIDYFDSIKNREGEK